MGGWIETEAGFYSHSGWVRLDMIPNQRTKDSEAQCSSLVMRHQDDGDASAMFGYGY